MCRGSSLPFVSWTLTWKWMNNDAKMLFHDIPAPKGACMHKFPSYEPLCMFLRRSIKKPGEFERNGKLAKDEKKSVSHSDSTIIDQIRQYF